jgi:hypothetical protein
MIQGKGMIPKTRSGKTLRRVLRELVENAVHGEFDKEVQVPATVEDASVVEVARAKIKSISRKREPSCIELREGEVVVTLGTICLTWISQCIIYLVFYGGDIFINLGHVKVPNCLYITALLHVCLLASPAAFRRYSMRVGSRSSSPTSSYLLLAHHGRVEGGVLP